MDSSEDLSLQDAGAQVIWVALPPESRPAKAVEFIERLGLSPIVVPHSASPAEAAAGFSPSKASLASFQRELPLYFGAAENELAFLHFGSLPGSVRERLRHQALEELRAVSREHPVAIIDSWAPFTLEFWRPLLDRTCVLFWLTPPASSSPEGATEATGEDDGRGARWAVYWRSALKAVGSERRLPVDAAAFEQPDQGVVAGISGELHRMGFDAVVDVSGHGKTDFASGKADGDGSASDESRSPLGLYRAMMTGEDLAADDRHEDCARLPTRRFDPRELALQLPGYFAALRQFERPPAGAPADPEEVNRYWARRFSEFRQEVKRGLKEERSALALSRRRLSRLSEKLRARAAELKRRNRVLYRLSRHPFYRWATAFIKDDEASTLAQLGLEEARRDNERFLRNLTDETDDAARLVEELSRRNGSTTSNALMWRWKARGNRSLTRLTYLRARIGTYSLRPSPTEEELNLAPHAEQVDDWLRENSGLRSRPRVSLLIPVHATPRPIMLSTLQSVFDQVYGNWEICLAVDGATGEDTCRLLTELKEAFPEKIRSVRIEGTPGIVAGSNAAADLATGDFIGLLDHDDLLTPDALLRVAVCADWNPDVDLIYSDEDKLTEEGELAHPFYKPDFSPELLDSFNYITHFTVVRRSLFEAIGRFREGFDGSQDYDLILRASEQARRVEHIARVLYHWRMVRGSTAADIAAKGDPWREASFQALRDAVRRRGEKAVVEAGRAPDTYRVRYAVDPETPVSIIIPTKDNVELLRQCVESLHEKTAHRAFEIIVVGNNTERPEALAYLEEASRRGDIRYLRKDEPFNYSALNNFAAGQSDRPYLLFLNDDTQVISPEWLTAMLEQAQRPPVGVVGARLLFEDRTVQHGGLIVGCGGVADHAFRGAGELAPGYFNNLRTVRNCSAVTGACMLVRREIYAQVGGMDENLACAFNDVDFCLRVQRAGYRNVFTPYAELFHFESKSRGYIDSEEKMRQHNDEADYLRQVWGESLFHDVYYNRNLSLVRNDYTPKTEWDREVELTFRLKEKVFS